MQATATVDGVVVAEAGMMCRLVDKADADSPDGAR
jgi:hypothetical protein